MTGNQVSFRAYPDALLQEIQSRGEPMGRIAQSDLARYYYLLQEELKTITLTEAEAMVIVDACYEVEFEPHNIRLLWAYVAESDTTDWIGVEALADKIRKLTPAQTFALVDAAARYWEGPQMERSLEKVGLVR